MSDEMSDEIRKRMTSVHWRYRIIGHFNDPSLGSELADTEPRRADAERAARNMLGPKGYGRVTIIDSMARRGQRSEWEITR